MRNEHIQPSYNRYFLATILLTLGAIGSALPTGTAAKDCMLGYNAFCSFAPLSTILCLLAAGFCCVVRSKVYTIRRGPIKEVDSATLNHS